MSDPPPFRLEVAARRGPGPVTLDGEPQQNITTALAVARPGSLVEIGRGRYGPDTETFPLRIPPGVTLRGPLPPDVPAEARKHLPPPVPAELVGRGPLIEIIGDGVTCSHLKLTPHVDSGRTALVARAIADLVLDTCDVSGTIHLDRVYRSRIDWTTLDPGHIIVTDATEVHITGGRLTTPPSTPNGIEVHGGTRVRIEALAVSGVDHAVALTNTSDVLVSGCALLADQTALSATRMEDFRVNGNRLRANRAVKLSSCRDGEVLANGFERAEIAIELEDCDEITVSGNHFGDVRIDVDEH